MDNERTDLIREYVRDSMSGKRYEHIIGVESEAVFIAGTAGLDGKATTDIRKAALLHDLTKEWSPEKQLDYCRRNNIIPSLPGVCDPTLHSRTGAYYARELFPDDVNDTVFGAIYYHTTGKENMSLAEKIICLADFIEPGRQYEQCRELRREFHDGLTGENVLGKIDICLCRSFDLTINSLIRKGSIIDKNTFEARNYLIRTRTF
ncbi:MAG: bis(5'-nucleosyl)-tetraphosphatase (symmetrical) YqeK [Clostridia bacterium]|nr:bis(5'-nucleosyl)-tetraphosphatase (symmetrical) YqeK [Clostridia bacterium]